MYAIVETGGKQVKVESGKVVNIEKLPVDEGGTVVFDKVLLVRDEEGIKIGRPYVDGFSVQGEVIRHFKGKKVIIMKHKRRKNYRRKKGHRQWLTSVKINTIAKVEALQEDSVDKEN